MLDDVDRCICGPDSTGEDIDVRPDCPACNREEPVTELSAVESARVEAETRLEEERHANEHLSAALARAQQGWKVALDDLSAVSAELAMLCAGLPEWHCPSCGATTRARMADHQDKETDRG